MRYRLSWRVKKKMANERYGKLHELVAVYTLILIVWGFYRLLFRFPEWVEELILKPGVFLVPVAIKLRRERGSLKEKLASVGITSSNWQTAIILGLALGGVYLFAGKMGMVYGRGGFGGGGENALWLVAVVAIATAISEQLVFMGYLLPRLVSIWKDERWAVVTTAALFGIVHLPILVFGYGLPFPIIAGQFLLVFLLGLGNSIVMLRVKNLITPVLSHALWGLAVLWF